MKTWKTNISDLGIDCWSPKRVLGECAECDWISRCKLKEAKSGRKKIKRQIIEKAKDITRLTRRLED